MTDSTDAQGPAPSTDTSFLGHPRGLAVLFFAEMWERFSYYGMRALLVTYLIWHFLQSESDAYGVYAAYAGMIYLAPVLGGYMADKYLGARKAVAFGAVLITMGHFSMAYEGSPPIETLRADGRDYEINRILNPDRGRSLCPDEARGEQGGQQARGEGEFLDVLGGWLWRLVAGREDACRPKGDNPQFVRTIAIDGEERRIERMPQAEDGAAGERTVIYRTGGEETASVTGRLIRVSDRTGENMMFLALALIIVGTGFLKANISAIVGSLYDIRDRRRDSGFTIFYMGINIGALAGILLVGWIGIAFGWAYGFGLAGVGMLLGLFVFLLGQNWLEGRADPPDPDGLKERVAGPFSREWLIYLGGIAAVGLAWLTVKYLGSEFEAEDLFARIGIDITAVPVIGDFTLFDMILTAAFLGCAIGVIVYSLASLGKEDRDRMIALLVLTLSSVVFWTLFDQAPLSLIVFQMRFVDTWMFTPQQTGFSNALFIVMLAPLFTLLWNGLARARREPSTPVKFALGLAQIGLGFLVLSWGISLFDDTLQIGLLWIFLMYLLHTTGELCLSPIGLSAVTKLSVKQLVGFMMGIWFLAVSIAQVAASQVAKRTATPEGTDPAVALAQFNQVYFWVGIAAIGAGVLMLLFAPVLKRMQHGRL
ncbi:MAG: peptide MFS transporter [Alphaproteobacteria bacterium]